MAACLLSGVAQALSIEERKALDLSGYRVTAPNASYFDVEARMALLEQTDNAILIQRLDALEEGTSCQQLLTPSPITTSIRIPRFYSDREGWQVASAPLFEFEDSVSLLTGSFVATGEAYYARCLVRLLDKWARQDALTRFHYEHEEPQAWFAIESMIFSAAMAYSVVHPQLEGLEKEQARIEAWLNALAHKHSSIQGQPNNSCCNNHFYRRALYASMVGVLTGDNELFRFGVSAIYSALHDMTEAGAFPLEIERGRRATHYQNYALLYLITNMQIIARQGYDIFDLQVAGHDIHQAVDFTMAAIEDPTVLGEMAPLEQYTGFLKDVQYFSWMEIYQSRYDHPAIADFVKRVRPVYNRSAGGYVTLYFMDPDAQQHMVMSEDKRQETAFQGLDE